MTKCLRYTYKSFLINIAKVAKTPYFGTYLGFSPGSICRFCLKVVQMCSFACPSTSRNQFGCLISAGLRPKKTALCFRLSVTPQRLLTIKAKSE